MSRVAQRAVVTAVLTLLPHLVFAQAGEIAGVVKDATGATRCVICHNLFAANIAAEAGRKQGTPYLYMTHGYPKIVLMVRRSIRVRVRSINGWKTWSIRPPRVKTRFRLYSSWYVGY
jgi:hypothetical protein